MAVTKEQKDNLKNKIKSYNDEYLITEITKKRKNFPEELVLVLEKELINRGYDIKKVLEDYKKNKGKDLPVNWFNFYTYFRIPAGILIALSALMSGSISARIDIFVFGVLLYGLHKRKLWGWKLNFLVIGVEAIFRSITLSYYEQIFSIDSFLIFSLLILLIWVIPNYIYFNNRKYLFTK